MGNKASLDRGEVEELSELPENEAEPVPWEGRVSPEIQDPREDWGTQALVGRRETMGETEWAAKVAEAKREKEDSRDTQGQRVHLVNLERMEDQDPKASEGEGEIQDLLG